MSDPEKRLQRESTSFQSTPKLTGQASGETWFAENGAPYRHHCRPTGDEIDHVLGRGHSPHPDDGYFYRRKKVVDGA